MSPMFIFVPSKHGRNPLKPHETQSDEIWEVRSIPGNLVGVGSTANEAVKSLLELIKWTWEEVSSFEDWYRESWQYADPGDHKIFGRSVTAQQMKLKQPKTIQDRAAYELASC